MVYEMLGLQPHECLPPSIPAPPQLGDRVMIVTTAGCSAWLHEGDPRLEGVRGTVIIVWDDEVAPDECRDHLFCVLLDAAPLPKGPNGGHLISSSFSADELVVVHDR